MCRKCADDIFMRPDTQAATPNLKKGPMKKTAAKKSTKKTAKKPAKKTAKKSTKK